jgi:DNA-binding CsgD family transcriptional regulator
MLLRGVPEWLRARRKGLNSLEVQVFPMFAGCFVESVGAEIVGSLHASNSRSVHFSEVNGGTMPTRELAKTLEVRSAMKGVCVSNPHWAGSPTENGQNTKSAEGLAPRFTTEESILLRSLATGNTVKEMAGQLRLPRESLFRLLGDLRRKTGAADDTALAVWVLRNMRTAERRGCDR